MARLDGKISLMEGESMFFQVKSNDGTQIAIRPFAIDGAGANYTLMQALSAAGLSAQPEYLSMVDRMMEEEKNILGIGNASIGPVDIRNGIILNPPRFYGVKHVPIKETIQKKYNLPVYFDHDNNLCGTGRKTVWNR